MDLNSTINILLILAIVLANIPFLFSKRIFFIAVKRKSFFFIFIEFFVYYIVVGVISYFIERSLMGNVSQHSWEFYVVTLFMFMIFAFPGFIYRFNFANYFRKQQA